MHKKLIVLAEDNPELHNDFVQQFTQNNYDVLSAYTGKELYSLAKEYSPAVLVSDTDMPDGGGPWACEKILRDFPQYYHIPIIGMSDAACNEDYWEGIATYESFILKGSFIDIIDSNQNLVSRVNSLVSFLEQNIGFTRLPDDMYRRLKEF